MRLLRHPPRPRPGAQPREASILAELRQLAASGYREVVLSAISLPSYGLDTGTNLVELVEKCAQVEGIQRIRLGSLGPRYAHAGVHHPPCRRGKALPPVPPELAERLHRHPAPDAPVYTAEQYAQVVDQIRAAYGARPVSFTTDCICGFPGETQADFEESCAFLKEIGFLKVHVFPTPPQRHPGLRFPGSDPRAGKSRSAAAVMNGIAEQVRCEALAALLGTEDEVLLETPLSGTLFTGYTRLYIPVVVSAPGYERADRAGKAWPLRWRSGCVQHFAEIFSI